MACPFSSQVHHFIMLAYLIIAMMAFDDQGAMVPVRAPEDNKSNMKNHFGEVGMGTL